MSNESSGPNWFVRSCVIAFLVFLATLAALSFRYSPLPFEVTSGIITVLVLMVVALLAESFNSISIGSMLRLQRDIARAESEKSEAKQEVRELRSSLLTMATTFHQSQVTNNFSGLDLATLRKALGVVEATPEEIEEEKQESAPVAPPASEREKEDNEESWEFRRELRKSIVDDLVRRFGDKYRIPPLEIRRDVKFESGIETPDPIMSRTILYQGYVKNEQKEYFLEIAPIPIGGGMVSIGHDERLYIKLAKIFFYKQIKKTEAELVYLEAVLPEPEIRRPFRRAGGRIAENFQPAIANNLLRIEPINITSEELNALKEITRKRLASPS